MRRSGGPSSSLVLWVSSPSFYQSYIFLRLKQERQGRQSTRHLGSCKKKMLDGPLPITIVAKSAVSVGTGKYISRTLIHLVAFHLIDNSSRKELNSLRSRNAGEPLRQIMSNSDADSRIVDIRK